MYETYNLTFKPQLTLCLKFLKREKNYSISLMLTVNDLLESQSYTEFRGTFSGWNNKYLKDTVKDTS